MRDGMSLTRGAAVTSELMSAKLNVLTSLCEVLITTQWLNKLLSPVNGDICNI